MGALVSEADVEVLLAVLKVDFMELFELVRLEAGFVDCDGKGEMIEDHHSWNNPEVEKRYVCLCVGLGFFFGLGLSFADVVKLINHLLILRFFFQVSQFGCFFCYFLNGLLVDDQFYLALI